MGIVLTTVHPLFWLRQALGGHFPEDLPGIDGPGRNAIQENEPENIVGEPHVSKRHQTQHIRQQPNGPLGRPCAAPLVGFLGRRRLILR